MGRRGCQLSGVSNQEDGWPDGLGGETPEIETPDSEHLGHLSDETGRKLRHHERTVRTGRRDFLTNLEGLLNRVLKPRKAERKPKKKEK